MNSLVIMGCLVCLAQQPETPADPAEELKRVEEQIAEAQKKAAELRAAMQAKEADLQRQLAELQLTRQRLSTQRSAGRAADAYRLSAAQGSYSRAVAGLQSGTYQLGVQIEPPDEGKGVVVQDVVEGSAAAAAEIRKGDRLLSLNKIQIDTVADLQTLLSVVREQPVELQVERQGEGDQKANLTVTVTPKKIANTTYSPATQIPQSYRYDLVTPTRTLNVPSAMYSYSGGNTIDQRLDRLEKRLAEITEMLKDRDQE